MSSTSDQTVSIIVRSFALAQKRYLFLCFPKAQQNQICFLFKIIFLLCFELFIGSVFFSITRPYFFFLVLPAMDNQRQHPDMQPGIPASSRWRGRSRPVDAATVKMHEPSEDALSESPARDRGAWRDPNHRYEDHEVLRCPWPGGRNTFSCPWSELTAEAAAMGLADTLARLRKNRIR